MSERPIPGPCRGLLRRRVGRLPRRDRPPARRRRGLIDEASRVTAARREDDR